MCFDYFFSLPFNCVLLLLFYSNTDQTKKLTMSEFNRRKHTSKWAKLHEILCKRQQIIMTFLRQFQWNTKNMCVGEYECMSKFWCTLFMSVVPMIWMYVYAMLSYTVYWACSRTRNLPNVSKWNAISVGSSHLYTLICSHLYSHIYMYVYKHRQS